jgi:hypothetical protein
MAKMNSKKKGKTKQLGRKANGVQVISAYTNSLSEVCVRVSCRISLTV